jgi:hypothetical protein
VGLSWERLAEPQADEYDTQVTLAFALRRGYQRAAPGRDPTWLDGQVAVRQDALTFPAEAVPAPLDHPNVQRAAALLRCWPAGLRQFQQLVDSVYLFLLPGETLQPGAELFVRTVSSQGTGGRFGTVAASVNDLVGLAEALLHEMAHHKLRALGVEVASAERILCNPPRALYRSPLRHDKLRPLSAILHAHYALTYLTALDVEALRSGAEPAWERRLGHSLAKNLPRLEFGGQILRANAQVDDAGRAFLAGLFEWSDRLAAAGQQLLDQLHLSVQAFVHPLDVRGQPMQASESVTMELPCRGQAVREHQLLDEMLLYSPSQTNAFSLNPSARAVWELCDGRHTLGAMCTELSAQCGRPADELLPDVEQAIRRFQEFGLLEPAGVSPARSS